MGALDAVRTPAPSEVPGFAHARATGQTPSVPPVPPLVTVRPTAARGLRDVVAVSAAVALALVGVMAWAGSSGRLTWAGVGVLLSAAAVGALAMGVAARRWGRAHLAELQRGYATTTFTQGQWWFGAAPGGFLTGGWVAWEWAGVWVLREDGSVRAVPTGPGLPPGLYPSPRRPGELELWTGCQWTGYAPRHLT